MMNMINEVNTAKAYIDGMLWAAFGVRIFSEVEQKRQMKQSLEMYIQGVKDEMKAEGKMR